MGLTRSALVEAFAAILCRLDKLVQTAQCACGQSPRSLHGCHLRREYFVPNIPVATSTQVVMANPERVYLSLALPVTTGTMWVSNSPALSAAIGILVTQDTGGRIEAYDSVHRTLPQYDWYVVMVNASVVHVQEVICGRTFGPLPAGANLLPTCGG